MGESAKLGEIWKPGVRDSRILAGVDCRGVNRLMGLFPFSSCCSSITELLLLSLMSRCGFKFVSFLVFISGEDWSLVGGLMPFFNSCRDLDG